MKVKITAGSQKEYEVGNPIGHLKNNWRLRDVTIYQHPTDPTKVITVGKGFKKGEDMGTDASCIEEKSEWVHNIGKFNAVYN